ncbi:MAG: iron-containing alcohol dehydrogenase, partial [Syntrophomonas sp.]
GEPWDMIINPAGVTQAVPLGSVLTLPATGSEMNPTAVITRQSLQAKLIFSNPVVYPRFSALDPTTTYTLPAVQISNGVVDTFIHITEQYLTYPVEAKVQDRFAEGLLLTLVEEGPRALQEPENYDVRSNLMWCATLGLNGLIGSGVPQDWATHIIGHEITALYGIDHAQTLAAVLPSLLQVCKQGKRAKLLQYAERVWGISEGNEDTRIDAAINKTREFFENMQIKTRLSDYNLTADSIPVLVDQLNKHGLVKLGEGEDITPEVVQKILELSL